LNLELFESGAFWIFAHKLQSALRLTVRFSKFYCELWQILDNDKLDAQIYNTFITILYMYIFWVISCSSSGGQIVLIQRLVSSLSVSDRPVHQTITYWEWRYQTLYNLTSWGWASYSSKHVEGCNKCIFKNVH
jgi:hypothetical protein